MQTQPLGHTSSAVIPTPFRRHSHTPPPVIPAPPRCHSRSI